jgi:hypothetical protein
MDTHLIALGADQGGLELAVEEVGDDRVVAQQVVVPGLVGHNLVRASLVLRWGMRGCHTHTHARTHTHTHTHTHTRRTDRDLLDIGLLCDAVQVFVKAVEEKRKQLLRVVLLVPCE